MEASPHLFLLEPSPSSKAQPQGFPLIYVTSSQAIGQVLGAQKWTERVYLRLPNSVC